MSGHCLHALLKRVVLEEELGFMTTDPETGATTAPVLQRAHWQCVECPATFNVHRTDHQE